MVAVSNPGVVMAFAAGMLSFLSPCVLPLVPGYLSLMSGVGTADLAVATKADTRRLLRSTLLFVGGFTVVFVALGATASAIGSFLVDHQRTMNTVAGVVVIAMGLAMAGVVTPAFMQREKRVQVLPSRLGSLAPPVMGMAFAFGWTPCLGPVLAALLTLAGAEATLGRGVALLFAYSLGLGVPFVAAGVGFAHLAGALAWVRRRARAVNLVSGLLLAGFGLLLLTNRLTDLSRGLIEIMDGTPFARLIGL